MQAALVPALATPLLGTPPTTWEVPDASNGGLIDGVGTPVPGSPGPFSEGTFKLEIPQIYRPWVAPQACPYSTAIHLH